MKNLLILAMGERSTWTLLMLNDYLDKMLAITFKVEPYIIGVVPSSVDVLARARAEQARTITSYQLHVHREIFEPMIRHGSNEQIAHARAMKVECIMLANDFRDFARTWAIDNVLDQWDVYKMAALALRDRIRNHISHMRASGALLELRSSKQTATSGF